MSKEIMNDKLVSLEAVKRTLENAYYGEATLGELLEALDEISPVESQMSAVEFVREHHRMCQSGIKCAECRICHDDEAPRSCIVLMGLNPDDTVAVVKEWAQEHQEEANDER